MKIEDFQIAYLRSSILYPFFGVPVLGAIAQHLMARLCLRRTLRLHRVMAELEVRAKMLEAQGRSARAHSQA